MTAASRTGRVVGKRNAATQIRSITGQGVQRRGRLMTVSAVSRRADEGVAYGFTVEGSPQTWTALDTETWR